MLYVLWIKFIIILNFKNPTPNIGEDYVDKQGKVWHFHANIGKQIPNGIWHSKFGFSSIRRKQQTLNLYCKRQSTNGGKCTFSGIYVKENGCLYTRGKHEHKYN